VLAVTATFLLLLFEPFYRLPAVSTLAYSVLAGFMAPLMALFVANRASNKIEAMTWQKLFNVPLFLPILAFYLPAPISFLFSMFPTYWAYSALDALINDGSFWPTLIVGLLYASLLFVLMVKRFTNSHFR
jgi:hypothetical protein